MNCFLPWNLKDMTSISTEKLQKNINRQTSYIELYRAELMKESLRYNIASLLRHVCMNRSTFGSDDFSKKATDCLIVFLHATSFLKSAYFTPTDVENPGVPKCCRNLHRLMLENVKATMRYIDYSVLLKYANGEVSINNLQNLREEIHSQVFPDDEMFELCPDESINDDFYRIVDEETTKATGFIDFDVQRNTDFDTAFCLLFSKMSRQDEDLPESEYGVIGESVLTLDKPFIKYGNSFYSFVTAYSFKQISKVLGQIVPEKEEPVAETVSPVEETAEEEVPAEEKVAQIIASLVSDAKESAEDVTADEEPIAETEQEVPSEEVAVEQPVEQTPAEDETPLTTAEEPIDAESVETEPTAEQDPEEDYIYESDSDEEEDEEPESSSEPADQEIIQNNGSSIYEDYQEDEFAIEEEEPTEEETEPTSETEEETDEYEEPSQEQEITEEEPSVEPAEAISQQPSEKEHISESIKEFIERHDPHQIIIPNQIQPSDRMDDLFDDDDFEEIFTEEEENSTSDSAYVETDEYEYPDEFEEDDSNSQEELEKIEGDVYELAEEDQMDAPEESQEEKSQEPEESKYEQEYSALVSDDTYRYLDEADPSEFEKDEMLEEQEILEDLDEYEDEVPEETQQKEEEDPYSGESLFSLADDEEETPEEPIAEEPEPEPEPVEEPEEEPDMSFPPVEDEEPFEESNEESEEESPAEDEKQEETIPEEPVAEPAEESEPEEPIQEDEPVESEPEAPAEVEPVTEQEPANEPEPAEESEAQEQTLEEPEAEPEPVTEEPAPEPDVLPLLEHILKFSPSRNNPITIYLMSCQFPQQKELVRVIELARKSWLIDGKDKMFSIPNTDISVAIFSESHDPMVNIQRRENIGAVMYSQQKDSWNYLELSFDTSGQMVKAGYNRVSRMNFSEWEWRIVEKLGNRIIERKGK